MPRWSHRPFCIRRPAVLVALVAACGSDGGTDPDAPAGTIAEAIDRYLDREQPTDAPGMTVLIRKDGAVVYERSRGLARIAGSVPITSSTGFRLASVTKPFTALAVLQLVDEGAIDLGDGVFTYLPELPGTYADITLAQLLTHEAGVFDYINDNTNLGDLHGLTTAAFLQALPSSGLANLEFAPGSRGEYSNTGYVLLALVVERASGMSFPEFMEERIYGPAGMTDSYVIDEHRAMGDQGEPHALALGQTPLVLGFNSLIYGANGQVSSLRDMAGFVDALLAGAIVPPETLARMTTPRSTLPDIADYGYGWLTGAGRYWHTGAYTDPGDFWHSGGFGGYRTLLYFSPSRNLEIVVLTNGGDATEDRMFEVLRLTREFYGS